MMIVSKGGSMKKLFFIFSFCFIASYCLAAVTQSGTAILGVAPDGSLSNIKADNYGNIQTKTYIGNNWNVLQPYTSAAFTIILTSVNATGTTTGRWTSYKTSATLEQLNSGGGAATNYFDLRLSTSNYYNRVVNSINLIPNWTATLTQGSYGLNLSTGTAAVRSSGEGTTDGLQWAIGGKATTLSTGTANTIYTNATQYIAYRKTPPSGKSLIMGYVEATTTWSGSATGTITVYEGDVSSNCLTQLTVPVPIVTTAQKYSSSYLEPYGLIGTTNYSEEYVVYMSTYMTAGYLGVMGKTE